jgi:hypothetical protein
MGHLITWVDGGAEPKNPPNPDYPNGYDLDMSCGAERSCQVGLPYPAKRIGYYDVECDACGLTFAVTTAGRVDDPRSVRLACRERK